MNDTTKIFRETFKKYIDQENGVASLKRFHEYSPETILTGDTGTYRLKDFWNKSFKKVVSEMNIRQHSNEQPDWASLEQRVMRKESRSEKFLGKRSRDESASSTSTPSTSSTTENPSSIITSTDSTNKRRKKLTTFLSEKAPPVVTLSAEIEKWEIAGVAISEKLVQYRKVTIDKAHQGMLDTYQEEMSINSIFLIDGLSCVYPSSQLEYGFDEQTWEAMTEECTQLYPVDSLLQATAADIHNLSKMIKASFKKCKAIVNDMTDDNDSIKESLRSMLSLYSPKASKKTDQLESTFSLSAVHPMILPFMEETDLTTTNGTDVKTRKEDCENTAKKGYQFSDLSVSFAYGTMPQQALVIVEIKAPHEVRTGSRPDLVKLANQMKDSLDKMIDDGMDDDNITVLGVLVEGFRCTLFVMDLKYQAIYRLIPVSVFYIPRDRHDFCLLTESYEALSTMQRMTLANADRCFQFHRNKKKETVRGQYVVKSFNTV